ncbi:MAG: hypothetical protein K6T83_07870 [Alicyclobacillus sp.]|nr:hypothetical protein [Alicyclobacillus sp.]
MPTAAQNIIANNLAFLDQALERNHKMVNYSIKQAGQYIDIELDDVPGWAYEIELTVFLDLAITVGSGGSAPNMSPFAPWNVFSSYELSLGGGPFQRVNPYFAYLRQLVMRPGWDPMGSLPKSYTYAQTTTWSVPPINAPAGATTDNYWQFDIRIPLQAKDGYQDPTCIYGHLPLGNASPHAKLRLQVASQLYGTDQYACPLYGGTNVTSVAIGTAQTSWVQPNIWYRTAPAIGTVPTPTIGYILNVQERATNFVGAGVSTPVKFTDPWQYLRLWHIVIDGTGAPNSTGVTNFELDLSPDFPQFRFDSPQTLQNYFNRIRRLYKQDLPTGVFVFDLWSGSDPSHPNGTQIIDGSYFQTLQTQVAVSSTTNTASPARIITYAEALSPVNF